MEIEAVLGALRRPQQEPEHRPELATGEQVAASPKSSYPKWAVVSGLVLYCALFWVLIAAAGTWGVQLVHTAMAARP